MNFDKRLKGYFVNAWNKYKQRGDNFLFLLKNTAKRETFQIIKQMFMASLLLPITISTLSKKNFSMSQTQTFSISSGRAKKAQSTGLIEAFWQKVETAVVLDNTENQDLRYLEIYCDANNKWGKLKFDLSQLPSSHAEVFTRKEWVSLAVTTPRMFQSKTGLIEDDGVEASPIFTNSIYTYSVQSGHHMFLVSE